MLLINTTFQVIDYVRLARLLASMKEINANGIEVNKLLRSYKDQNISDFHQVWTCDDFFPLTFASSYLIHSFGALADQKSESKE